LHTVARGGVRINRGNVQNDEKKKLVSEILHWTGTYASTNVLVTCSLDFPHTLVSRSGRTSAGMVLWGTSTPRQAAMQHCHLLLHQKVAGACSFPWDVVKQLFRCTATAYLSCSLSSSQNASNGSPTQGLHVHLYTWWLRTLHLTTNWLLGVAVVLGPSAMFTFIDFTALFFQEAKWPSGFTVTIVSCAKTRPPTCLYCTDIRI